MSDDSKYLVIRPNNASADKEPARHHIYVHLPNGSETRKRITGFSYFGEVGGRKSLPPNKPYVVLIPPQQTFAAAAAAEDEDEKVDEKIKPDQISMTYAKWLDKLKNNGINMSRIFVYIDVEPEHCLFTRNGKKYNLKQQNADYFFRLKKYVELAADREIIVQITLAGIQTLRANKDKDKDLWAFHPLRKENNTSNQFLATDPDHPRKPTDGVNKFFNMRIPDSSVEDEPSWNYKVQSRTLEWILDATSGSWNVIYELFNEPPPPGVDPQLVPVREWLITTAKWLDERLRAGNNGVRKHLIALNAHNSYLYNKKPELEILKQMLFKDNGEPLENPLVNVFSFHGLQWGGDDGKGTRLNGANLPADKKVINEATAKAVKDFYNKQFDFGNNIKKNVKDAKIAVIIDSDAQYCAQDSPKIYGEVVMQELNLDYNHRWSDFWLSKPKLNTQLSELKKAIPKN